MTQKKSPTLREILEDKELSEQFHFLEDGQSFLPAQLLNNEDTTRIRKIMGFFGDDTPMDTWLRAWWFLNEFVRRRGEGLELVWVNDKNEVYDTEYEVLEPGAKLYEESE